LWKVLVSLCQASGSTVPWWSDVAAMRHFEQAVEKAVMASIASASS
jgi:hypothetical protein